VKLSCTYRFRPKRPSCNTSYVQTAFGIGFEPRRNVTAEGVEVDYRPGSIVLFSGPSGSGKSSLLREAARQAEGAVTLARPPSSDAALIDTLTADVKESALLLSLCGLGDAMLMLRCADELSDGQRYRYSIARGLAAGARTIVADEWCATLDRITAKVISRNARKVADKRGVGFLVATTHEDILADLDPDAIVWCRPHGLVEVQRRRPFAGRSVFSPGSKSPAAPARTGRTSLGGITGATPSARSGTSACSGTARRPSESASSATGHCPAPRAIACSGGTTETLAPSPGSSTHTSRP
jgi:hypothetical protein